MLSWKYANLAGNQVSEDLLDNHGVKISKKLIQSVNERVGEVLIDKEQKWNYENPVFEEEIETISISRDGTTVPIKGEKYKETMVGTIALYNKSGKRLHTIYNGCSPESGKTTFDYVFREDIKRIEKQYPNAKRIGIADGEKGNWSFLNDCTQIQILDFWHATEYLGKYAKVAYKNEIEKEEWLKKSCHKLKNKCGGATRLYNEMKKYAKEHKIEDKENPVSRAVTYFGNQKSRMKYWKYIRLGIPIGSGIVEAGCKTLVKQRFSRSGSRWTRDTVDHLLLSRGLILTQERWNQFWNKIDRYGF